MVFLTVILNILVVTTAIRVPSVWPEQEKKILPDLRTSQNTYLIDYPQNNFKGNNNQVKKTDVNRPSNTKGLFYTPELEQHQRTDAFYTASPVLLQNKRNPSGSSGADFFILNNNSGKTNLRNEYNNAHEPDVRYNVAHFIKNKSPAVSHVNIATKNKKEQKVYYNSGAKSRRNTRPKSDPKDATFSQPVVYMDNNFNFPSFADGWVPITGQQKPGKIIESYTILYPNQPNQVPNELLNQQSFNNLRRQYTTNNNQQLDSHPTNNYQFVSPNRRITNKNYRDDKTHEPSNEENEEAEEDGAEKIQAPEFESLKTVPTQPDYPGEGKWAIPGTKHRPFVSNHKFTSLQDDEDERPEGYETFEKAAPLFERQNRAFSERSRNLPLQHAVIRTTTKEQEAAEKQDHEEVKKEDEDEDFVPSRTLSQVRKTENEEHLPSDPDEPRLREAIKDSKIHIVYTEEGYEDIAYDHEGHEKHAEDSEGHEKFDKDATKARQKIPKKSARRKSPGFDAINVEKEFENYAPPPEDKSNDDSSDAEISASSYNNPKPSRNRNVKNYITRERKTKEIKDVDDGEMELEITSEIKIMTKPNNVSTAHKFVKIVPKTKFHPREENLSEDKSLKRQKRYVNDIPKIDVEKDFLDVFINEKPRAKPTEPPEKYPYYNIKDSNVLNSNSPLRYAEDLRNAPIKVPGRMSFYEHAKVSECPEIQTDVDPIPDRVKNAEKREQEESESEDDGYAEQPDVPRLRNLGDKIDCLKTKLFGENPLDSPIFRETIIEAPGSIFEELSPIGDVITTYGQLQLTDDKKKIKEAERISDDAVDRTAKELNYKPYSEDSQEDYSDPVEGHTENYSRDKSLNVNEAKRISDGVVDHTVKEFNDRLYSKYSKDDIDDSTDYTSKSYNQFEPSHNEGELEKAKTVSDDVVAHTVRELNDKLYSKYSQNSDTEWDAINRENDKDDEQEDNPEKYLEDLYSILNKNVNDNEEDEVSQDDTQNERANNAEKDYDKVHQDSEEDEIDEKANDTNEDYNKVQQDSDEDEVDGKANDANEDYNKVEQDTTKDVIDEDEQDHQVYTTATKDRNKEMQENEEENDEDSGRVSVHSITIENSNQHDQADKNYESSDVEKSKNHFQNKPDLSKDVELLTTQSPDVSSIPKHIRIFKITETSSEEEKLRNQMQDRIDSQQNLETSSTSPLFITIPEYLNRAPIKVMSVVSEAFLHDQIVQTTDKIITSTATTKTNGKIVRPKHIYDQIDLLDALGENNQKLPKAKPQAKKLTQNHNENSDKTNLPNSRQQKSLNNLFSSNINKENSTNTNSIDSPTANVRQKNPEQSLPESAALRVLLKRRRRPQRPGFQVFDINRFLPTPLPPGILTYSSSTVLPKYKTLSEVYYKDEIQPNEQLNVFADVINNIKNSPQDGLSAEGSEYLPTVQQPWVTASPQKTTGKKIKVPSRKIRIKHSDSVSSYSTINNDIYKIRTSSTTTTTTTTTPLPRKRRRNKYKNHKPNAQVYEEYLQTVKGNQEDILKSVKTKEPQISQTIDSYNIYKQPETFKHSYFLDGTSFYNPVLDKEIPTSIIDDVIGLSPPAPDTLIEAGNAYVNTYVVSGMKPPNFNKPYVYSTFRVPQHNRVRRKNYYHRIHKRSPIKYAEIKRNRPAQSNESKEEKIEEEEEEEDDYVPQRNRNFHYDVENDRVVYLNKKEEENEEIVPEVQEVDEEPEDDGEYLTIVKATPPPKLVVITTERNGPSFLQYINQLKNNTDYRVILDPVPTKKPEKEEKEQKADLKEVESSSSKQVENNIPEFLNFVSKLKSADGYKEIRDKKDKPKATTAAPEEDEENEEIEAVVEEVESSNVRNSPGGDRTTTGFDKMQIFDISEYLPQPKTYTPKTVIDYSKYKTIQRPRYNMSSRYSSDDDDVPLRSVDTTQLPILATSEDNSTSSSSQEETINHMRRSGFGSSEEVEEEEIEKATTDILEVTTTKLPVRTRPRNRKRPTTTTTTPLPTTSTASPRRRTRLRSRPTTTAEPALEENYSQTQRIIQRRRIPIERFTRQNQKVPPNHKEVYTPIDIKDGTESKVAVLQRKRKIARVVTPQIIQSSSNVTEQIQNSETAATEVVAPNKLAEVQVFQNYDPDKKHGGNYRREEEKVEEAQENSAEVEETSSATPSEYGMEGSKEVERLTDVVPKPVAFYSDPMLPNNVNQLKESKMKEGMPRDSEEAAVVVSSVRKPSDKDYSEEYQDEVKINFSKNSETVTKKPVHFVKDPSKRLYYYAPV